MRLKAPPFFLRTFVALQDPPTLVLVLVLLLLLLGYSACGDGNQEKERDTKKLTKHDFYFSV